MSGKNSNKKKDILDKYTSKKTVDAAEDEKVNEFIIVDLDDDEIDMLKKHNDSVINAYVEIGELFVNLLRRYTRINNLEAVSDKNMSILGQRYRKEIENRPWHIDIAEGKLYIKNIQPGSSN